MKRIVVLIWLCIFCCAALCGCAETAVERPASGEGYTFTDDAGRAVTVTSTARGAALLGSYADIWMLSGGSLCRGGRCVG